MRLTLRRNRWTRAALLAAWVLSSGCQRLPYIDQSKPVPHDNMGRVALEDKEVKQADLLSSTLAACSCPRWPSRGRPTTPRPQEVWPMTLQEAIRIGLDNSEVVRVIAFGAQGIPIGGFEPTPLEHRGRRRRRQLARVRARLQSVYDPAILETQIATALSNFDTAFTTSMLWGNNTQPFNNGVQGGSLEPRRAPSTPIVSVERLGHVPDRPVEADGDRCPDRHRPQRQLVVPEQLVPGLSRRPTRPTSSSRLTQPLLGSAPLPGQAAGPPVGLEANRAPIVIARLNADAAVWRFKAEVMAHVRSIEQQYWNLAQAARPALELPTGPSAWPRRSSTASRPSCVVGRGTVADVAEAAQRLEQFNLDLVTRTSDVITTERQLRNILGLPPADNRRIIPVTPPTEARLEPDWDSSLAQMLTFQPDIVQQQILVRVAELQLLIARNQLLPAVEPERPLPVQRPGPAARQRRGGHDRGDAQGARTRSSPTRQRAAGLNSEPGQLQQLPSPGRSASPSRCRWACGSPLANTRQAQYILLRQRAYLQQVVHQTTHSLARFFLEIDANYKQFKTASRLRAAAAQRLDAQRAYYEEGRITIDRFLDAVSQYATAVATEAQYKTTYNISIVALEEAKGTLLAYDNIAVAEGPHPRKAYIQARDIQDGHRQFPIPPDGPMYPQRPSGPANPDPVPPNPPPDVEPGRPCRRCPAPVGPLGPPPTPLPPYRPAGEPPILSQAPAGPGSGHACRRRLPRADAAAMPASATVTPAAAREALPRSAPADLGPQPAGCGPSSRPATPGASTAPSREPADELPVLPEAIDLPPLPRLARQRRRDSSIPDRPEAGASPRTHRPFCCPPRSGRREVEPWIEPPLADSRELSNLVDHPAAHHHNNDHSAGRSPARGADRRWRDTFHGS